MELVLDYTNVRGFKKFIDNIPSETQKVYASIAYNSIPKLLNHCIKNEILLDWYGLFDFQQSTQCDLLETALKNKSLITFYPIKENFHSKVIYVPGYGAYIGSANMTNKAISTNIECGVILDINDFEESECEDDLIQYFGFLKDKFTPLIDEDLEKYKEFIQEYPINHNFNSQKKEFEKLFEHLVDNASASAIKQDKIEYQKRKDNKFIREWRATLNILRDLMKKIETEQIMPKWIDRNIPIGIITDAFINAYYDLVIENEKKESSIKFCKKIYEKNKSNNKKVLNDALRWWKNISQAEINEDFNTRCQWYKKNLELLSREKLRNLTCEELQLLYSQNHTIINHAWQVPREILGLDETKHTKKEHIMAFAKYHYSFIALGKDVRELLYYVIYGKKDIASKICEVLDKKSKWHIPHLGESILGEIIGWAKPEEYPIRNDRVNKVLLYLGFDVKVD